MIDHLDKFMEERLQSLDLSHANPANVAELIIEEYSRDGIEYMSSLTLVFLSWVLNVAVIWMMTSLEIMMVMVIKVR